MWGPPVLRLLSRQLSSLHEVRLGLRRVTIRTMRRSPVPVGVREVGVEFDGRSEVPDRLVVVLFECPHDPTGVQRERVDGRSSTFQRLIVVLNRLVIVLLRGP